MSQDNIQTIKNAYAAFGRGDLPGILELVADSGFERWGVVSSATKQAPWYGMLTTKGAVASYFERLLANVEPAKFEPQHFAAEGPWVYVSLDHEYVVRKSGRVLRLPDSVMRFKLSNGRIVAALVSEDTAAVLEALEA